MRGREVERRGHNVRAGRRRRARPEGVVRAVDVDDEAAGRLVRRRGRGAEREQRFAEHADARRRLIALGSLAELLW